MMLLPYFASQTDQLLDLLRQLVEIESPSTEKAATDRLTHFVEPIARQSGAETHILPQTDVGDHLLARWGEEGHDFLLLCHLDTVWPLGTIRERPWRIVGQRAYGPGVLDEKASIAIVLTVMHALYTDLDLRDEWDGSPATVTVFFNSDEEIGSRTSRAQIEYLARDAQVVFCMEPARPDGSLKVARKGTGRYTITSLGRAAHAGSGHAQGINAIEELAHQILRLQAMTDYAVGTTVSVGWVRGGTRSNVIPDQAQARLDVRVRTRNEGERINAAIHSLQPVLPGATLTVKGGMSRPPMKASPVTLEPFKRVQEIGAGLGLSLEGDESGGASDANFTAALGIPTLDGMGAIGDHPHHPDEYVWISSLAERAALLAALLTGW